MKVPRRFCSIGPALFALLAFSTLAGASTTTTWEMSAYSDFLRGRFQSVALGKDGHLSLAPRLDVLFSSEQPAIWTTAALPDGALVIGTGHRGRVYRVGTDGKAQLLWTAPQPEVFAVAAAPDGTIYAATSPDGKVYRLRDGQAVEFYDPKARYIWSLAIGKDNALYVGTGDQGIIHRVTGPNQGEVWYESGQAHITALATDREGRLLAGSEPNGILYRITGKERAFVLHDANLPEIRAIVPEADGSVYVTALGGSVTQRAADATTNSTTTTSPTGVVTTSITVTDKTNAQVGPDVRPRPDSTQSAPNPNPAAITAPPSPVVDVSGVEKSALYRIRPDNTVETIWSSREENAYDLLRWNGQLYLGTDQQGRIYRLEPDRKVTLFAQTEEGEVTRLISSGNALLAATSSMGRLYRLAGAAAQGSYESPVHDAGNVSRWGRLTWQPDGSGRVLLRTRSGNSARPDKTWSDWSPPLADPAASTVTSPNARYVQWRAEFQGGTAVPPSLRGVSLAYLPQNTPPVVRTVNVTATFVPGNPAKTATAASAAGAATYSITVSDTGEVSAAAPAGTPTQTVGRSGSTNLVVAWAAEDADGDRLISSLYYRAESEREWRLLRAGMNDASFTVDADIFADGRYLFRVVVTDRPANPPDQAQEAELLSAPILLDGTPPIATIAVQQATNSREVQLTATDATSPLRRLEYSLDARPWIPVTPDDGIVDGLQERARLSLGTLSAGEHVLVVRAVDAAGNTGLARMVIRN